MKIGILTFCNTVNYGASLQAFALVKALNHNGVEAELINYKNKKIYSMNCPKSWREGGNFLKKVKNIIAWKAAKKRWDSFRAFEIENIPMGAEYYTEDNLQEIQGEYDRYVIGSDQVWNLDLTGIDKNFFLPFIEDKNILYTYAASFGYTTLPQHYEQITKQGIEKIDYLTVREESASKIIAELCQKRADVVVDPTLLLRTKDWLPFIDNLSSENVRKPYILLYLIDANNADMWDFITQYAKRYVLDIIWITPRRNLNLPGKKVRSAGPKEFLNLIYHADLVVTGSFHAVCFSIQFSKKFVYVMKEAARASRITNLLSRLELNEVIFRKGQNRALDIDYSKVQNKLEELRLNSLEYIKTICAEEN